MDARRRGRTLEENMYNDLAHASGGEYKNSLQVSGPGTGSPDLPASQLLCDCGQPGHSTHKLCDKRFFPNVLMPPVIMSDAVEKMLDVCFLCYHKFELTNPF